MTRYKDKKLKEMLAELKESFRRYELNSSFFTSEDVEYAKMPAIVNGDCNGWHVWISLKQPISHNLSEISDISPYLPDHSISYETFLIYNKDGLYIIYSFTLKDWFDGRE